MMQSEFWIAKLAYAALSIASSHLANVYGVERKLRMPPVHAKHVQRQRLALVENAHAMALGMQMTWSKRNQPSAK